MLFCPPATVAFTRLQLPVWLWHERSLLVVNSIYVIVQDEATRTPLQQDYVIFLPLND